MTRTCTATHDAASLRWYCSLARGHAGRHAAKTITGLVVRRWATK